ncbi:tRNA pseudouridine(54/55) synthase Pus10 [Candidatus Nanohalovita haloferacivicina]|uniref:tRNA pseudouridine(54/55) synthase Pus10 n=1 Tax=Candidatus Nanohalovita haloferacivicina TaxID=2978046 RepID=UPI00325FD39B
MNIQTVADKASRILENEELCDHCLGRQFAQLGHGLENWERGAIIRDIEKEELDEDSFVRENIPEDAEYGKGSGSCELCDNIFGEVDRYTDMVIDSFERYELETFLVGIRPPEEVFQAEEDLWEEYSVEWTEPVKTELSRLIGKRIEDRTDLSVNFERADIMAVVDMREGKERVELQVNSLLIYSQYNKYSREIPQTEWHCRNCRGSGCDECDWTGKNYPTSVQEEIMDPFLRESKAIEAKFHGNGREDVDAKCFGRREFVLELIEPLNRDLDLEALQEEVNESTDKIEIFETAWTHKDKIEEIKETRTDKAYRAKIELSEDVDVEDLEVLEQLIGTIEQRTPERVEHRRADKVRKREVYEIDYEKTGECQIEIDVKAEAGTYIKEMISSDGGRTEPSVAGLLGVEAECTHLDVSWVEKVGNE